VCPEQPQSSRLSTVSAQPEFTHSTHTFFPEGCSCSFFKLQHFLWHTILILLALVFILTGIQRCQFVNIFSFCSFIEIIWHSCHVEFVKHAVVPQKRCRAVAKVVSHWPFATESGVWSQAIPCGIYGRQSDTGMRFTPSTSVFLCHYHSTNVPYLFIHLSWPQYNQLHGAHFIVIS